jgi:hypothetical protein
MGVWGTGIFSDDTASDVRAAYREYLAQGMDGMAATDKVLHDFRTSIDDPDDGPPLWLGLAAIQSRYGRLELRVRDRAVAIIDNGTDLARFAGKPQLHRARARVLEKLREQLFSPQRAPVKIRAQVPFECDWEPSEIVGFRRDSGEWLTLYVRRIHVKDRDRYPEICILDIPFDNAHEATATTRVRDIKGKAAHGNSFRLVGLKKRDQNSERIRRTGKIVVPPIEMDGQTFSTAYVPWKQFENFLSHYLLD